MPRLSVLLPVRDAGGTLLECLDSLAAQTLADHEVVVVDDGSEDTGADILDARAREDSRIRVVRATPGPAATAPSTPPRSPAQPTPRRSAGS